MREVRNSETRKCDNNVQLHDSRLITWVKVDNVPNVDNFFFQLLFLRERFCLDDDRYPVEVETDRDTKVLFFG